MDSVRFGRALGVGARAAAKTLMAAADAATSPNPSASKAKTGTEPTTQGSSSTSTQSKVAASGVSAGQQAVRTVAQVRQTGQGLKQGSKRFGEAVWGPFVKLSGVLWLEVTGVFFALFAVFAAGGAWKLRDALRDTGMNHEAHVHFLLSAAMAAVFGYFCVSSFVKASLRGKRR
jgi:Flp pilus assembly protein TadB